tara:strand:+ start:40802 stop:42121 length:1320 start_codon:yes stop_codon:yes gene_type:complete
MYKLIKNKPLLFAIHLALGFVCTIAIFAKLYAFLILIIGSYFIIKNKNANEEAILAASYIVGAEVFLRMTHGVILFETGKYGVFFFLILGLFVGKNNNKPNITFFIYILLLLLGIVFTSVPDGESIKNAVVFNLSGPILLGFCSLYFYKRKVTKKAVNLALFYMVLPIISTASYLYFRTPSLKEIVFTGSANFDTSGGFGPNQVATVLGVGIFIFGVFLLQKKRVTGYLLLDGLLFTYLIYRALLTFSRGGLITGIAALVLFVVIYYLQKEVSYKSLFKIVAISIIFGVGTWLYTSNATGGMLDNRYTGKNASGIKKKDVTSGRLDIIEEQLQSFYESPIVGIGVGNGKFKRQLGAKKVTAASHNEISRLIEEHGLIGVFSLLLLISVPISIFWNSNLYQKAYLVAFICFWFLTIGHSAMRIAFPSFIYGLGLIKIIDD